jgi:hypothetical protein
LEAVKEGHGGMINGQLVDRREVPQATPIEANAFLGVPDPSDEPWTYETVRDTFRWIIKELVYHGKRLQRDSEGRHKGIDRWAELNGFDRAQKQFVEMCVCVLEKGIRTP